MGWKGYELTIPAGMIFKKMYCHKCGTTLNKIKVSKVYKKGDIGYTNQIAGLTAIGMDKIEKAYYIYRCNNCGLEITYEEQCIIAKKQKKEKKKILEKYE